jgi:fructosamine-3-kinase
MWNQISEHIGRTIDQRFDWRLPRSVSGGCINQGFYITNGALDFFVKVNRADRLAMFEAEALGLRQMAATRTIRVPMPICWGTCRSPSGPLSYIVLEWLDLGDGGPGPDREMGRKLAQLHQVTGLESFGWTRDNTIGSTPQVNPRTANWVEFWCDYRVGYQLAIAAKRGSDIRQGEALMAAIPELLAGHSPEPSLVHGDLWGGNAAILQTGEPVIFDPAAYWGDREVDVAMTELFGGFSSDFYTGYRDIAPLDAGYDRRKVLYNLYHVLNHYNLFGSGYAGQANRMIEQLLGFCRS